MIQGYTEDARRVIFSARAQAMQDGSLCIESEHILLAILDESETQGVHLFGEASSVELLKKEIKKNISIHEPISGSVEVPLTLESKQILTLAFDEASELNHKQIGIEHLLIGALQCQTCVAAKILYVHGATIDEMRKHAICRAQNSQ